MVAQSKAKAARPVGKCALINGGAGGVTALTFGLAPACSSLCMLGFLFLHQLISFISCKTVGRRSFYAGNEL